MNQHSTHQQLYTAKHFSNFEEAYSTRLDNNQGAIKAIDPIANIRRMGKIKEQGIQRKDNF